MHSTDGDQRPSLTGALVAVGVLVVLVMAAFGTIIAITWTA